MIKQALRNLRKMRTDPFVKVTRAGGFYRARIEGSSNFVFGETSNEALERLRNSPAYRRPAERIAKNAEKNKL